MVRQQCTGTTKQGQRCRGQALPGEGLCFAHSPNVAAHRDESRRRGGQNKANAQRAAKQWAAIGRQIPDEDLPAVVKALILSVRAGTVEPAVATCIANLAKVALQLHGDIELEARVQALEAAAAEQQPRLRRVGG